MNSNVVTMSMGAPAHIIYTGDYDTEGCNGIVSSNQVKGKRSYRIHPIYANSISVTICSGGE